MHIQLQYLTMVVFGNGAVYIMDKWGSESSRQDPFQLLQVPNQMLLIVQSGACKVMYCLMMARFFLLDVMSIVRPVRSSIALTIMYYLGKILV